MKSKEDKVYLLHIRDSIEKIEHYTNNIEYREFKSNSMASDAVIRQIQIIGDASKNISLELKDKYSFVPWKGIAGMRDKIVHNYFNVNIREVWGVAKKDIPTLKKSINSILIELDL